MELGDSDNRSLVATTGTCSISGCLAVQNTLRHVRQNLGDSHLVMFLKSKLFLNLCKKTLDIVLECFALWYAENNKKTWQILPVVNKGRAFTIRGREREEKLNVVKRFTVNILTERDRTFTESGW